MNMLLQWSEKALRLIVSILTKKGLVMKCSRKKKSIMLAAAIRSVRVVES